MKASMPACPSRWPNVSSAGRPRTGQFDTAADRVLQAILDTRISRGLIPVDEKSDMQSTEDKIGPYELHDFCSRRRSRTTNSSPSLLGEGDHPKDGGGVAHKLARSAISLNGPAYVHAGRPSDYAIAATGPSARRSSPA